MCLRFGTDAGRGFMSTADPVKLDAATRDKEQEPVIDKGTAVQLPQFLAALMRRLNTQKADQG